MAAIVSLPALCLFFLGASQNQQSQAPLQSRGLILSLWKKGQVSFLYGPPGWALALPYRTERLANQGLYRGLTPARRAA